MELTKEVALIIKELMSTPEFKTYKALLGSYRADIITNMTRLDAGHPTFSTTSAFILGQIKGFDQIDQLELDVERVTKITYETR